VGGFLCRLVASYRAIAEFRPRPQGREQDSVSQAGYALPSVLLLITILSIVALSILALHAMQREQVYIEAAKIKSEYAAQSAVARTLAKLDGVELLREAMKGSDEKFQFSDATTASVHTSSWGVLLLVEAVGECKTSRATRIALAGQRPPTPWENALVMRDTQHQLVFTGTASVKGNIQVGSAGVTTGTVQDLPAPARLPIDGKIEKGNTTRIPEVARDILSDLLLRLSSTLEGSSAWLGQTGQVNRVTRASGDSVLAEGVADSVDIVYAQGSLRVSGQILRRTRPLCVVAHGRIIVEPHAALLGLIALVASGEIEIRQGATFEHPLLFSQRGCTVSAGASFTGQLIAPRIEIDSAATLHYPSAIVSCPCGSSPKTPLRVTIRAGGTVEGFAGVLSTGTPLLEDDLLVIEPTASLTGTAFSESRMTLDGSVAGSVITSDFFFYLPPTMYVGWLRSARIDRTALPSGYLIPALFGRTPQLDIVEWL
jgi:hypothetical protein